ncbi:MAG: BrnT family toxin [Gallionella sp.]|nr:BrnT family toxin [Gallionella sp.]
MNITFDPSKDAINIDKHGVSLAEASKLDWECAMIWADTRYEYGEERFSALVPLGNRLYFTAFVYRSDTRRIISLRKANDKEVKYYAAND